MSTELYSEESADKPKKAPAASAAKAIEEEPTLLERLKETISAEVDRPVVLLEVPERKGVYIRISPNISQSKMRHWRKQAGEETKNGLDPTKFACFVVGHTTTGFEMDGEEVLDEDGLPTNFASTAILKMTGTGRPVPDAVRNFFGTDPHVEAAALAVLEAAGFSDTVDTVDPTNESLNSS